MKKFAKRFLTLCLCLLMLVTAMPAAVFAEDSEVPYYTYTMDKWKNATPAPNGYLPTASIGGDQLGCGSFNNAQDLFYNESLGRIYLADSGNGRVLVFTESFEPVTELKDLSGSGEEYRLSNPQGLFVLDDGTIYVCDMSNQQVVLTNEAGELLDILPTPESNVLPDGFNYQPSKIVVDDAGRIYILSKGVYQGIIYLDTDGTFIKFFGANNVEMTFRRRIQQIWKTLLSDKAAATMQSFNPIEYGNLFLSEDGYIYATAAGSENGSALMTKLNPLGIDCLPWKTNGSTALFADITVNNENVITMLSVEGGSLYQINADGDSMFAFGGIGAQTGLFQKPVSLIEVNERLYVLDSIKNSITAFELTQFGKLVHEAMAYYEQGLYEESIEPWKEVISHNSNYLLAYTGLGKAYYQLKDYDTAMYYFKLANDRANYSLAFKEASLLKVRGSFAYIVLGIAAIAAVIVTVRIVRNVKWRREEKKRLIEESRKKHGDPKGKGGAAC